MTAFSNEIAKLCRLFPGGLSRVRQAEIAIGPLGEQAFEFLKRAAQNENILWFEGGASSPARRRLHIHQSDASSFRKAAGDMLTAGGIAHTFEYSSGSSDILVEERQAAEASPQLRLVSRIEIDLWSREQRYWRQGTASTPRPNPYFRRLPEQTIETLFTGRSDIDEKHPDQLESHELEIDAVITWVDPSDPEWRNVKARYQTTTPDTRADHPERYRDRQELLYALRGIELFAPFIRRIFLVTCGHAPEWLRRDHPRLRIVSHSDIFKKSEHLPTFNSNAIESQTHHIDGLAEHFIALNDDFFIARLTSAHDFFFPNGIVKFPVASERVADPDFDRDVEEYIMADWNSADLLKRDFGVAARTSVQHSPYPSRRSILFELEDRYPDAFDRCASNRFRTATDIRSIPFLQYHYGFATGRAVPTKISHSYVGLWRPDLDQRLKKLLRRRNVMTICLNDGHIPPEREKAVDVSVRSFLSNYFPFKSSFEK